MDNKDLRDSVLAFARSTPSPTRRQRRLHQLAFTIGAGAWIVAVVAWSDRLHVSLPTGAVGLAAVAASISVAVASSLLVLRRGRSMLGPSTEALLTLVLGVPPLLLLSRFALTSSEASWSDRPVLRCLAVGVLVALGPLAALVYARRGTVMANARLVGSAIALASAAAAWAVSDLLCRDGDVGHLVVGHVAPLVGLAAAGALLGRLLAPRWVAPRRPPN